MVGRVLWVETTELVRSGRKMTLVKAGQVSKLSWGQGNQAEVDLLVMAGMVVRASGGFLYGQVRFLSRQYV